MSDQDDYYYLQPGFDLASLTVPRIRSILVAHGVAYPSSAKKQDLLDLVQQEIVPKSKRILAAQARVKRTSKGITDVPSSQEELDEDTHGQEISTALAPRTPRSRKSKSNLNDVNDDAIAHTPRTSTQSKTPAGRRSIKVRTSDTDAEADRTSAAVRRSRKSTPSASIVQPSVKLEEPNHAFLRRSLAAADSPFSDDNPFQSGSSPPSESKRLSSTSRTRRSLNDRPRKSSSKGRQSSSPEVKREGLEHVRSTYEVPVSRIGIDRNGVEATEEFTPEAGRELEQDLVTGRQLAMKRESTLTRHKRKPTSTAAKTAPLAVLISVLAAVAGWYRQEKVNIGFCGVGEPSWSLASNPNIPAWVHDNLQPRCEFCPPHATCYPGMEVRCDSDFILQSHPLALNGLIPLPPTCEPDSEKERKIKAVADRAIDELRMQRAVSECGQDAVVSREELPVSTSGTVAQTASDPTKAKIPVEALKTYISKQRKKGMTEQEFEALWVGALENVKNREEVEIIEEESGRLSLSSTSLARLPFTCAIRKSLFRSVSQNRIPIAILILAVSSIGYGRHRLVAYNRAKAQVPSLVSMTLDRLITQAALSDEGRTQESFISVAQLRDAVLRSVISARDRERAWHRVRKIVEGNSNVRAATREGGKTGEWSRVWEWIGPVDLAPGSQGRKLGMPASILPDASTQQSKDAGVRRWNEGQPYY